LEYVKANITVLKGEDEEQLSVPHKAKVLSPLGLGVGGTANRVDCPPNITKLTLGELLHLLLYLFDGSLPRCPTSSAMFRAWRESLMNVRPWVKTGWPTNLLAILPAEYRNAQ
jgi:hypothetical protein